MRPTIQGGAIKDEAPSAHHLLTRSPYNRFCPTCARAKMFRKPARRIAHHPDSLPKQFGEHVNADRVIAHSEESMGLTGERDALVVVDRATGYMDCYPLMSKSAEYAHEAMLDFFGPQLSQARLIHTDMALELISAVSRMGVSHSKSTPYRHTSNATCERAARKVVEGAWSLLEHAGLPNCFWPFAMGFGALCTAPKP